MQPGTVYRLSFRDVDGEEHSTASGHVTIITVITRENEANANAVADLMPDYYFGDPKYRYITLVNFQRRLFGPVQGLTRAIIRQRLDAEAHKLKPKYEAKKINRDPREDTLVVADFNGEAVARLGLEPENARLAVFVFSGSGKLIACWNEVPPGDSLAKAIAEAR